MVNQRDAPEEDKLESSETFTTPWNEVLDEIIDNTIATVHANESDDDDDGPVFATGTTDANTNDTNSIPVVPTFEVESSVASSSNDEEDHDNSYEVLWSDTLATIDVGNSANESNMVVVSNTTELYEVEVSYHPGEFLSYMIGSSSAGGNPLNFYLVPNVQHFNPTLSQPNTNYIQLTPSVDMTHYYASQNSIQLNPATSQVFEVPSNTHSLYLLNPGSFNSSMSNSFNLSVASSAAAHENSVSSTSHVSSTPSILLHSSQFGSLPIQSLTRSTSYFRIQTVPVETHCLVCSSPCLSAHTSFGSPNSLLQSPPSVSSVVTNIDSKSGNSSSSRNALYENNANQDSPHSCVVRTSSSKRFSDKSLSEVCAVDSTRTGQSNSGRRRRRRTMNGLDLTKFDFDEQDRVPTLNGRSHFGILFRDEKCFQVWNNFVQSSEESQNEILQKVSRRRRHKKRSHQKRVNSRENKENEEPDPYETAFRNLSDRQQSLLLGQNLPYGMVVYLEDMVVEHFQVNPMNEFISPSLSSFERLILHSVAAYYSLLSETFENAEGTRLVNISTRSGGFVLPIIKLSEYIALVDRRRQK